MRPFHGPHGFVLGLLLSLVARASAQDSLAKLPALTQPTPGPTAGDWLLHTAEARAKAYRSEDGRELILDNGLIRRVWRLEPNAACVAFDNLMTGAAMLRAVRPEARVVIDGQAYDVGGLTGQPNHAYLTDAWLDQMSADPKAMRLLGFELGQPRERLSWPRNRHHAPDAVWPPTGVHLRLDFGLPPEQSTDATRLPSAERRALLLDSDFTRLGAGWSVYRSDHDTRCSFENEGKVGEIFAPANCSVYAIRRLPKGTRLVECEIDPGTDKSASWGPGIALVFKDRIVKFTLRTGDGGPYDGTTGEFGDLSLWDGQRELLDRGRAFGDDRSLLKMDRPYRLRLRLDGEGLHAELAEREGAWTPVFQLSEGTGFGAPIAVRLGKTSKSGGADDHTELGDWGRCRIRRFAAYGDLQAEPVSDASESRRQQAWRVSVHYELYDNVPVMSKWIEVHNESRQAIEVDRFRSEILAVVEHSNHVEFRKGVPLPEPDVLHVETDYAFGGFNFPEARRFTVHWRADPQFHTQVNWAKQTPCLLVVEPTRGPAQRIEAGASFESFRAFELAHDSSDRERRGLALRRMYRTIAPWVTENPLILHVVSTDPAVVRTAIDQAAECGFEMLSLSFGSGLNMEDESEANLVKFRELNDYAQSRGIHLGGYSLLSSRRIGNGMDVVSPPGERPTHGNCPALTSEWGQEYFRKLRKFFEATGFLQFTHDGSYPGDFDITPRPPLQRGLEDSQWAQWRVITDFYKWLRARGAYLRVPDYYFLTGANECGMGYREVNWSLPRAQQVIHTRQNIYDGTWQKTPSMGWMFVPLTQYHGGGAAATIEPLDQHLEHYERMLASNLGLGVQAVYRGRRLYDTPRVRDAVRRWVQWYKKYRDILESDLIHGRRADGRELDWMLHVNPRLENKGLLAVYNPTSKELSRELRIPLYYTGLREAAEVSEAGSAPVRHTLDSAQRLTLRVRVPAASMQWYLIR